MWDAVQQLGFVAGDVLEPGCGAGCFISLAPQAARIVGVELEPTTAAIAAALHPQATIRNESFAETRIPEGSCDVVIGNVPFGDIVLHDRRHNASGHRIHNHFILKSLHLTRPGGVVALVTSRYTMDAANPEARREMAALADLVGAVRLPTGAHRRAAGTDVVTDLLILRRREPGASATGADFERTQVLELDPPSDALRVNEYFLTHPQHVLGTFFASQADRGRVELGVAGERDAAPALEAALRGLVARARELALVFSDRSTVSTPRVAAAAPGVRRPDGYLSVDADGNFTRIEEGLAVAYHPPATQAPELRALLGLRDTVVALLEAEAASVDDAPELDELRSRLNRGYDRYLAAYGPLNRFTERRTGRADASTGEERVARIRPRQGGFRADPYSNVVYALEHFDSSTQTATKATIFTERAICRPEPRLGADTPADALSICMDTHGDVRLDEIARLLGVSPEAARTQLGTLVFDEPGSGRLVPAAEYLSGNVRQKLAAAETAQLHDGRLTTNVAALTEVVPRELGPDEIHAQLGTAI